MTILTKQWCQWGGGNGKVSFSYDDTVAAGFPFGKMTAITWQNSSTTAELVSMTLRPGDTGSTINAGTVSSIPLAAGSRVPLLTGMTVLVGAFAFTASGNVAVGGTSIPVTPQAIGSPIPAASTVYVPLPAITIPAFGQTAQLPPFYGGGTVQPTDTVNIAGQNIPMGQITSHGQQFPDPPADLTCVD